MEIAELGPDLLVLTDKTAARFWKKVEKSEDGCWVWTAARSDRGYGMFMYNSQKWMHVHRLSYLMHIGKIPEGLLVCHSCDNRVCIRPDHLWAGTPMQNTTDMILKGRARRGEPRFGEKNHAAKLDAESVSVIKRRLKAGESQYAIARDYPVCASTIHYIRDGTLWKDVEPAAAS